MSVGLPVGVLVMAYGAPASLDEVPGYLADIRAGRPTPASVLDEITENYRAIGGGSPLLEVTRAQVDALAERLGDGYRCYLGMRHWAPWIEEVVGEMVEDGITHAVGLVLAPHFSALSVARYQQKVADGLQLYRGRIDFEHVSSYHDSPGLVEAFAGRVRGGPLAVARGRARPRSTSSSARTAFPSASSPRATPTTTSAARPRASSRSAPAIPEERWSWATSRRAARPSRGRGRTSASTSSRSPSAGSATSSPCRSDSSPTTSRSSSTSTSRHGGLAESVGIRLERPPALNDDPVFIEALAELVRARSAAWLPEAPVA